MPNLDSTVFIGDITARPPPGFAPTSSTSRPIARPSHHAAFHAISAVAPRFVHKSVHNIPRPRPARPAPLRKPRRTSTNRSDSSNRTASRRLVRRRYEKIGEIDSASDEELDTAIRAALTGLTSGKVVQLDDACFEVDVADRIWVVSPDCRSIYGVGDATLPRPSGTATPLDDLRVTFRICARGRNMALHPAGVLLDRRLMRRRRN
jgi:hypothetical protein